MTVPASSARAHYCSITAVVINSLKGDLTKAELLSLVLLAITMLTGCDAGAKSLNWYKAHDAERKAKYKECTKASDQRGTEDCRNAINATVHGGSYTKSPDKSW
ncbi:EexN family lipoprotein [Pantoea agglomerans]|nr:EexN family lipoprotein [Pantoea agglomerans]NEG98483.1 EexN family lipoprotein [Pantoea agglomerans]NEH02015.1 EexN family lipoprotein [Pantoea agglomerans]NEH12820.1 EexN family lipoprotein [Pantoea agglomerans]